MPYKNLEADRKYKREWAMRKRHGLTTRMTPLQLRLTPVERMVHKRKTNKKSSSKRRQNRKAALQSKFGNVCIICSGNYYLTIHEKHGKAHKKFWDMTNEEFQKMLASEDFIELCYDCHKAVHWCMTHLDMTWEEIRVRLQ